MFIPSPTIHTISIVLILWVTARGDQTPWNNLHAPPDNIAFRALLEGALTRAGLFRVSYLNSLNPTQPQSKLWTSNWWPCR
ncbi:hypothetical protein BT96DRAFT_849919, partial [Gymnopus androsaceus JB14]